MDVQYNICVFLCFLVLFILCTICTELIVNSLDNPILIGICGYFSHVNVDCVQSSCRGKIIQK